MLKNTLLLFSLFLLYSQISLANFNFTYSPYAKNKKKQCKAEQCLHLDEVVERAKKYSYSSKAKFGQMARARLRIQVKMASLFPSVNLMNTLSAATLNLTAIPDLLGFLFPSNWYNWKESKLIYLAQRESYKALLANQVSGAQELYYYLHQELIEADIYKHYYKLMDDLIAYLEQEQGSSDKNAYGISRIKALDADIKVKALLLENDFKDTLPLLAHMVALPINEDWDKSSVDILVLPDLSNKKKKDANIHFKEVTDVSPELKSIKYLLHASKYSYLSRKFQFLNPGPNTEVAFGLGYFSGLEIKKSNQGKIQNQFDQTQSQLKVNVHAMFLNYNTAIDTYKESIVGREATTYLMQSIFDRFKKTGQVFFDELVDSISAALNFDLKKNRAQHYFLLSQIKIDRLLLSSKEYEDLDSYLPEQKKPKRIRNFMKRLENDLIMRDIKKNKLILE